jgi:hypothetical protein
MLNGEAVEKTRSARGHEIVLAAAARAVDCVPRRIRTAEPVVVADDRIARAVARPVVAGRQGDVAGRQAARRVGARQDVVDVRLVADAVHLFALLVQRRRLADVVTVRVQILDVGRDQCAARVEPRSAADAVARVHDTVRPLRARAQVRAPGRITAARCRGQRLAMCIGTGETAEIGAVALPDARDEKAHRLRRRLIRLLPLRLLRGGRTRE